MVLLKMCPIDEARRQFEVNIFGLARLTQLVLPKMRQNRYGKIVNISSMGGKIYTPFGGLVSRHQACAGRFFRLLAD